MKISGKIIGANIDFRTNKPRLTLEVNELNDFKQLVDDMNGVEKLSIEIKPFRKKRSLDANAYFWTLADKLAEKIGILKIDIYREYIRNIGGNSELVCVRNDAVKKLRESWEGRGLGWCTETVKSKLKGCTNVILYYGSSTYDTAQMKRLLDMVIQDCTDQGIPTETPDKIEKRLSLWGESNG